MPVFILPQVPITALKKPEPAVVPEKPKRKNNKKK